MPLEIGPVLQAHPSCVVYWEVEGETRVSTFARIPLLQHFSYLRGAGGGGATGLSESCYLYFVLIFTSSAATQKGVRKFISAAWNSHFCKDVHAGRRGH